MLSRSLFLSHSLTLPLSPSLQAGSTTASGNIPLVLYDVWRSRGIAGWVCVCVYLDFGETFKDPCDCLKPNSLFTQTILSQATLESSYFTWFDLTRLPIPRVIKFDRAVPPGSVNLQPRLKNELYKSFSWRLAAAPYWLRCYEGPSERVYLSVLMCLWCALDKRPGLMGSTEGRQH